MYRHETYDNDGNLIKVIEREYTQEEKYTKWQAEISATDQYMPRQLEDVIDALSASVRSKIAKETLDKYENKKLIRSQKPKGV